MDRYKFLVSGPVGAGKTTAIESASDKKIVHTDVKISDTAGLRKEKTTVAMDYGSATLSGGKKAHVYGTPGQERFDFMWDVLSKGTQGLMLLFDNSRNYPQRDLAHYTKAFSQLISEVPLIIGVTCMDVKNDPPVEAYQQWLVELDIKATVMRVDAREQKDVIALLEMLARQVEGEDIADVPTLNTDASTDSISTATEQTVNGQVDGANGAATPVVASIAETKPFEYTSEMLSKVNELGGVTGVMLSDEMGDVLHTTVNDEQFNDFSAFLAGVTPMIEDSLSLGKIHRVMLKSRTEDNVTFFLEEEQSLAVTSDRKTSVPTLTQQVKDVLQWG